MWYPIIFVLSVFLILVIVVRRAFILGDNEVLDNREETGSIGVAAKLPNNPGETESADDKFKKAEQLYSQRKYFAAEKWYIDVTHMSPENDKAWARLGTIAMTQKRYKAAVENFERSVEVNSNVPSRHYNLALAYFMLGNKDHARACINLALKASPDKANYIQLLQKIEEL